MHVIRHDTAESLIADAGDYLAEREAEHNLPLGILSTLRDQPHIYPEPPYLAVVRDGAAVGMVAVRTPPYGVVLSEAGIDRAGIDAAVELLADDLVRDAPALPTVSGPKPTVEPFARRWSAITGAASRLEIAERVYRLSHVVPPPPVPGAWRLADERDGDLLMDWVVAFHEEAVPPGHHPPKREMIDLWARREDRFAYLWEVDGRPVSLAVAGSRTPNGRRIGPVYTPPAERRHGYAAALTAVASQDQLDRGRRFLFLFTDLANPTANGIYQRIGYQPVTDVDEYRFEAPE